MVELEGYAAVVKKIVDVKVAKVFVMPFCHY